MAFERSVHILVVNRDGRDSSSLENPNLRIKIFDSQASLDQWLMKHYSSIENNNIRHEQNIEWMNGIAKSGHKDVLIIRREKVRE